MKKIILILSCVFVFLVLSFNLNSQNLYYWSNSKKINLFEDKSSMIINFSEIQSSIQSLQALSLPQIKNIKIDSIDNCAIVTFNTIQEKNTNEIIAEFGISQKSIKSASFSLKNEEGFPMWLTNRIVLKFKQGYSLQSIKNIMQIYNTSFYKIEYDMVILDVHEINQVLTVSNQIYESGFVEWCHPDFIAIHTKFDDPLYPDQFYLNNIGQFGGMNNIDINAPEAWLISKGCSNIVVAVIDDGIENHEDIDGRVLSGYTAGVPGGIGYPGPNDGHGECCAGIIAASHNNIGIKGIAPNTKILPIDIFNTELTSNIATAINWAWQNGADILSNSWGYNCSASFDDITSAITNARTQGRNGKGCIVIFSAGNNSSDCVTFPANVAGVIAVGSIDKNGQLWNYSAHGNRLDIVAPSGSCNFQGDVRTTDRMGNAGFNPSQTTGDLLNTNYTAKFGGTSAACPQVSGVAALMLSVNPDLTEQQATNIIKKSAIDMGKNGKDYFFGYGRLDASRALFESIILSDPFCEYTEGVLNLTCVNNNKKMIFAESPKPGIAHGAYFVAEFIAEATISYSTPFVWYIGQGLSGANPNNGNYFLIKNDNGSSIYLKTWFYYIWYDTGDNSVEQWVPTDPNYGSAKKYVVAPTESLYLKNITVNIGESKTYQAINTISVAGDGSNFIVEGNGTDGGSAILKAGNSIILKPGFHAKAGSYFHAFIEPHCLSSSNFCTFLKMLPLNESENFVYANIDTNDILNPENKRIATNSNEDRTVEEQLTVYPNPNKGLFSIVLNSNDNRINKIEIYNLFGKQVLTKKGLNNNIINLNISDFPKSIYLVKIYSSNKIFTVKIVYE